MFNTLWNNLFAVYAVSALIHLASVAVLWLHWRGSLAARPAPWWIQINMAWKLMSDGELPRTNGRLTLIALLAFVPFLGTGFALAQCAFPFVYAVYALLLRYLSAWWEKPVQ